MSRFALMLLQILSLATTALALLEELIPSKTAHGAFEYTHDCHKFRLAVHQVHAKHPPRRIGFLTFDSERHSAITKDPKEAAHFYLVAGGDMKSGQHYIGSRNLAAQRGWGPLKLHGHPTKEAETWHVKAGHDRIHFSAPNYTYGDGQAVFCHSKMSKSDKKSTIFAQYFHAVPASFECKVVHLIAQCVDKIGPNPSDTPRHWHSNDERGQEEASETEFLYPAWQASAGSGVFGEMLH